MHNLKRNAKAQKSLKKCSPLMSETLEPLWSWPNIKLPFVTLYSAQSTLTNRSRLRLLHRREEHVQDLFSITRKELAQLAGKTSDSGAYTQFTEGAIVQGFLQIMESKVFIHTRIQEADTVKQAAEAASRTYRELTGRSTEFEIVPDLGEDG